MQEMAQLGFFPCATLHLIANKYIFNKPSKEAMFKLQQLLEEGGKKSLARFEFKPC